MRQMPCAAHESPTWISLATTEVTFPLAIMPTLFAMHLVTIAVHLALPGASTRQEIAVCLCEVAGVIQVCAHGCARHHKRQATYHQSQHGSRLRWRHGCRSCTSSTNAKTSVRASALGVRHIGTDTGTRAYGRKATVRHNARASGSTPWEWKV